MSDVHIDSRGWPDWRETRPFRNAGQRREAQYSEEQPSKPRSIVQSNPTDAPTALAKSALRASRLLGLADTALAGALGLNEIEIAQLILGTRSLDPVSAQGQLALQLVRVYIALVALVGSDDRQLHRWMRSHNTALGLTPEKRIQTPEGLATTVSYLNHMVQPS